jgi:hypothetical protein
LRKRHGGTRLQGDIMKIRNRRGMIAGIGVIVLGAAALLLSASALAGPAVPAASTSPEKVVVPSKQVVIGEKGLTPLPEGNVTTPGGASGGVAETSGTGTVVQNVSTCGNGTKDAGEQCGESGLPNCWPGMACVNCKCSIPVCGDGRWAQGVEKCDGSATSGTGCWPGKTCKPNCSGCQ